MQEAPEQLTPGHQASSSSGCKRHLSKVIYRYMERRGSRAINAVCTLTKEAAAACVYVICVICVCVGGKQQQSLDAEEGEGRGPAEGTCFQFKSRSDTNSACQLLHMCAVKTFSSPLVRLLDNTFDQVLNTSISECPELLLKQFSRAITSLFVPSNDRRPPNRNLCASGSLLVPQMLKHINL